MLAHNTCVIKDDNVEYTPLFSIARASKRCLSLVLAEARKLKLELKPLDNKTTDGRMVTMFHVRTDKATKLFTALASKKRLNRKGLKASTKVTPLARPAYQPFQQQPLPPSSVFQGSMVWTAPRDPFLEFSSRLKMLLNEGVRNHQISSVVYDAATHRTEISRKTLI